MSTESIASATVRFSSIVPVCHVLALKINGLLPGRPAVALLINFKVPHIPFLLSDVWNTYSVHEAVDAVKGVVGGTPVLLVDEDASTELACDD
jgi:hypothetical protein